MRSRLIFAFTFAMTLLMPEAAIALDIILPDSYSNQSPQLVETSESITWRSLYHFHNHNYPLPPMDSYPENKTINYVLEYRDLENCIIYRHLLAITSPKEDHCQTERTYSDTILDGHTYNFYGTPLTLQGTYIHHVSNNQCDTNVTINLFVNHVELIESPLIPEQCAGNGALDVQLAFSGTVSSVALHFSDDAIKAGFSDITLPMTPDGLLTIPYTNTRAGQFSADISALFRGDTALTAKVNFIMLYPTTVMEQRWNDVLIILGNKYNGGYYFTDFQWYKNGQPLHGENKSYLYQPLDFTAQYTVLLTEPDGTQLLSCPIVPTNRADISAYPTILNRRQALSCHVSAPARLTICNSLGQIVLQTTLPEGDSHITMPDHSGIFVAHIALDTNDSDATKNSDNHRTYKLLVR